MTAQERKYETIVKRLRKRYTFLEDVTIDVVEGYGIARVTKYNPATRSIYVDLKSLHELHSDTKRFKRRFGQTLSFDNFVLHILLHEFAHVKQFDIIPNHRLYAAINETDYNTNSGHDECWVEQEADKWARQEYRKIKKGKK